MADPKAELFDTLGDPHVLVHWPEDATEADVKAAAQEVWMSEPPGYDDERLPVDWRLDPCRLYRWVPGGEYSDYTRELHWARKPGPGAFWAVECWPIYATDLVAAAPAVQGEGGADVQ